MEKSMIEDNIFINSYMPKELCSIGRDGEVDDCDSCSEYCENIGGNCLNCAIHKCFDRLAEYEKTGLTPHQIVEIYRFYKKKCDESAHFEPIKGTTFYGKQIYVKKDIV